MHLTVTYKFFFVLLFVCFWFSNCLILNSIFITWTSNYRLIDSCELCSSSGDRCKLEQPCHCKWESSSGGVLGTMVWTMPDDCSGDRRVGKRICWEDKLLQTQHWWQPQHCHSIWHKEHSNCALLQRWREERKCYWCSAQVHLVCNHRKICRSLKREMMYIDL